MFTEIHGSKHPKTLCLRRLRRCCPDRKQHNKVVVYTSVPSPYCYQFPSRKYLREPPKIHFGDPKAQILCVLTIYEKYEFHDFVRYTNTKCVWKNEAINDF